MTNSLLIPLYADKPRRKISGTDFVAVTMYRSHDGSVREFTILSSDGECHLGKLYYQGRRSWRPACYTMEPVTQVNQEWWHTMAEYVVEMQKRLT